MIQSNEKLLPGNVVMYNHEDGDRAIKLSSYVIFEIATDKINQRSFSPIPLTPEILVQWCGCSKHTTEKDMYQNKVGLWIVKVEGKEEYFMRGFSPLHTIKYLHEFQNVSYCNSGEEMPVNIPNH